MGKDPVRPERNSRQGKLSGHSERNDFLLAEGSARSSQRTEKNERGTAQPIVLPVSRTNAPPSLEITEQKRSGPAVTEAIGREGKSCLIFAVGFAFQPELANFDIKPSDHDTHADDPGRPSFRRNRPVRRKPAGMGTARTGRIPCRSRTGMDSGNWAEATGDYPTGPRFSYRRPYGNYPLTRPERPSISSRTRPKSAYVTGCKVPWT